MGVAKLDTLDKVDGMDISMEVGRLVWMNMLDMLG